MANLSLFISNSLLGGISGRRDNSGFESVISDHLILDTAAKTAPYNNTEGFSMRQDDTTLK